MRLVLTKLALVDRHEVVRQAACLNGMALWHNFRRAFRWVRVDETEVFVRFGVSSRKVKVCGDVARQSVKKENKK